MHRPESLETSIYRGVRDLLADENNRGLFAKIFPRSQSLGATPVMRSIS